MTRINAIRNIQGNRDFVAWGKNIHDKLVPTTIRGNINALVFAAVLIVCSLAVGCSSDKPKPVGSNSQISMPQTPSPVLSTPAPVMRAENKPAPKKPVQHKKPATVNYTDKTYGVAFEYPRRYAIETGNAAADLLTSSPLPMNFVAPGGVALAAVELPETGYVNTDFSYAYFNVSVNKNLTTDQCNEFAVPAPKVMPAAETKSSTAVAATSNEPAKTETKPDAAVSMTVSADAKPAEVKQEAAPSSPTEAAPKTETISTDSKVETKPAQPQSEPQGSKLLLGDMELRGTEAVSGEGTRQSDAKYFHVYQNGACYEFGLNVTTVAQDGLTKHVDRDKVFSRLEQILNTVKINQAATPEVTAETPATSSVAQSPAQ
ncbi:MAG TPA: hypothetical protein VKV39_15680 [Candidatus Sulfotelmatobacter sp.]|nr:hypothetical protein [Candidatus Sulfotelmatobacter sp.]